MRRRARSDTERDAVTEGHPRDEFSWFRHLDRERRRAALDRPRRARRHGSHAREGQLAALSRHVTPAFDGFPSITCPPGQRICWYTHERQDTSIASMCSCRDISLHFRRWQVVTAGPP